MFKKHKKPEPKLVKKTVDVPKIKVELHFVGKNGEMEKYVEKYEGKYLEKFSWCIPEDRPENVAEVIAKLFRIEKGPLFLENNNRTMHIGEYFTLTKAVILDTKMIEKEIEVYE